MLGLSPPRTLHFQCLKMGRRKSDFGRPFTTCAGDYVVTILARATRDRVAADTLPHIASGLPKKFRRPRERADLPRGSSGF